ncbi:uncharacterized protein [Diadema setosum]|uniref:uncharacterized protein n=1 Tax=Diadema setosum TaxID=31175 RepID=UPI003B3A40EF
MALSYVGLNVGGIVFQTSSTTLNSQPENFFTSLLSGQFESAKDEAGNFLIDRDGQIFRHVLNYMRNGKLVLPERFDELALLDQEADFFQLGSLKADIKALREATLAESVTLNVGGRIYQTTRSVLSREPGSVFRKIIDGHPPSHHGQYFIDGDQSLFVHILRYLRFGYLQLLSPPFTEMDLNLLEAEAKSMEMDGLLAHVFIFRMLHIRHSSLGRGVAMFSTDDQFVFYSNDNVILAALSHFGRRAMAVESIKCAWESVYVVALHLDSTKIERQVYMQEFRQSVLCPANGDEMVDVLSSLMGRPFIRKAYATTCFAVFGWSGDIVGKFLREIM